MAAFKAINLQDRIDQLDGPWRPSHVMTVNSTHSFKVAKLHGEFVWHSHPNTDETFYCVSGGPLRLELSSQAQSPQEAERLGKDHVVELSVGEMFCVPQGMQHRPVADAETGALIIEKVGTVNTGDQEGHERTVYVDERQ